MINSHGDALPAEAQEHFVTILSFSHSKLTLQQVMDLMYYWSQGLDSHIPIARHCGITGDATIVDWKNFIRDICVEHCLKYPAMISGVGHIVEIDESAWAKRKYNRW